MALKTGRTDGTATVTINYEECTACGLCIKVCKGMPLYLENGQVHIDQTRLFGCIGCGQCAAVCPKKCITVEGRCLSPEDIIEMPSRESRATYEELKSLMLSRRSVRDFSDKEIEREVINKIINAASTSPMGIPPSDVEILVLDKKGKVKEFANDMIDHMQSTKWFFSPFMRFLLRPFIGKETCESVKTFIVPIIEIFAKGRESGIDWLLYNAPLAMYFHTSPYADPVDPIVPATYAMLAAESLGLGSCMIGTIGPFLKSGGKKIKKKYGIPSKNQQGIMAIFGYSAVKYKQAIKRTFANVNYI